MERILASDSKDSKHLGFFGNDPQITSPKISDSFHHCPPPYTDALLFFLSPFSSLSCSLSCVKQHFTKADYFFSSTQSLCRAIKWAFLGCWKWSVGFESETFVERQKWSEDHESENFWLVPSLVDLDSQNKSRVFILPHNIYWILFFRQKKAILMVY